MQAVSINARALAGAVAFAMAPVAGASVETLTVNLGAFKNVGSGRVHYAGPYGDDFYRSLLAADTLDDTVLEIDLARAVTMLGYTDLAGIRIVDTGANRYGLLSPGADIDLLAFEGLAEGTGITYSYLGPNAVHAGESSGSLGRRVGELDSFNGAHDRWDRVHVSLGEGGKLWAMLSEPQLVAELAHPTLFVGEAGFPEAFRVQLVVAVPAPGALPLAALAAVIPMWPGAAGSRRRRRSRRR